MELNRSWSSRRIAVCNLALLVATSWLLPVRQIAAETWNDSTGKYKVEAQFVAIQGDKVTLKKADGTVLQVSLTRLDSVSQVQAKRLAAPAAVSAPAGNTSSANNFQTPDVYIRELMLASEAGDYQKIWNALPNEYQKDIHDIIHSFAENMDANLWNQGTTLLKKAVRVLKEKRSFILGHPRVALTGDVLAKTLPPITEALDATINSELCDLQKLKSFDLVQFATADGKNIAQKLKAASEAAKELQKLPIPAAAVAAASGPGANPFANLSDVKASDVKITLVKHEGDCAVLKFDLKDKPGTEQEWVQSKGKWLPKKMVDDWQSQIAKAKTFTSKEMKQKLNGVKGQVGFFIAPINQMLDQMLAAQSQEQFNQVIENIRKNIGGLVPGVTRPVGG